MIQAEQIRPYMQVVGNDGELIGMVDSIDGDELRLTRSSAPDGKHHFLPLETVEFVDDRVHLNRASNRAMAECVKPGASCTEPKGPAAGRAFRI